MCDSKLREVTMRPYVDQSISFTLMTYDAYRTDRMGKSILRYALIDDKTGSTIFQGEDFACSPMNAIDSDESLRALLTFLTLRPGDTDAEYFENYTQAQLDFANEHGEILSMYAMEDNPDAWDVTDQEESEEN
jgi:hypothetical protein